MTSPFTLSLSAGCYPSQWMCGISIVYSFRDAAPGVDAEELQRTSNAMRRRGPDGSGLWVAGDRRVGMAHRRLAIIDTTDAAAQPMWSGDRRFVIVFNGEIYNHRKLRARLERRGAQFRTQSDTEVLLQLYASFGREMLDSLRGMYAFAIWDTRKQELFVARDPYGIKPLYYSVSGGVFRAASQVKALIAGGGVSREVNPGGVVGFLLRGSVPEPFTTVADVAALPAGTWLTVSSHGASVPRRYFSLATELCEAAESPPSESDAQEVVREAVTDSIRHHLVSDVPVGAFLSAGKDSTTIAAIARELGSSLRTVTLGFDEYRGTPDDEVPLAARVAQELGIAHTAVMLSRAEFQRELPHALEAMDQPSIDGLNSYFVSRAAAQAGMKVVLSGTGGDELFGGYTSFRRVPETVHGIGQLARIPGFGRLLRMIWYALLPDHPRFSPKTPGIVEYGGTYAGAYLMRRGLFMPWEIERVVGRDLAREGLAALDLRRLIGNSILPDPGTMFGRVAALESSWFLRDQLLRDVDWASMAHSVEVRVPLVDVNLLRAIAPLTVRGRARGKNLLVSSPRTPLPDEIRTRPKSGFTLPLRRWLFERESSMYGMREWGLHLYGGIESSLAAALAVDPASGFTRFA
jgi:asparagine synthase (glutamine-hydrolysing)